VMSPNGPAGNYSLTALGQYLLTDPNFAGQTDTLLGPVNFRITIRDFSQIATPTSLSFNAGSSGASTLQLTSLNHFTGTVSLSVSCVTSSQSTPSGGGGGSSHQLLMLPPSFCPPATLNPTSLTLSSGSSASSTLTVSTPNYVGNYTLTVAGVSGSSPVHASTVTVFVNDFNVTTSSTYFDLAASTSRTSTLTLYSLNKFAGTVTLSANIFPGGLLVSFNPVSVSLTAHGTATSVMNITIPSGAVPGSYIIQIVATGGGNAHALDVGVTVKPAGFTSLLTSFLSRPGVSVLLATGIFGMMIPSAWFLSRSRARHRRSREQTLRFLWTRKNPTRDSRSSNDSDIEE
jgi:hypothetical protein